MNDSLPYASRLDNLKPEGAYAVMAEAQALEAEGQHIIHLEIGQPDIETFPHIRQAWIMSRMGYPALQLYQECWIELLSWTVFQKPMP